MEIKRRKWQVQIQQRHASLKVNTTRLRAVLRAVLNDPNCRPLPPGAEELSILLTDDAEIRGLNREYRGKDRATDVLSFGAGGTPHEDIPCSLGDIVVSLDTAKVQAETRQYSLEEEVLRLLLHGLLHLLGYDHEGVSRREVKEMQKLEDLLWSSFRERV